MHPAGKIGILAVLLLNPLHLLSQMPEWKYFKDRDGNAYFIDRTGKIQIARTEKYHYKPVSATGIDYHLQYGITLIKDHRLTEGLSVLKSILALPVTNNRIYGAQAKAAEVINTLKRQQGTRYAALNESAAMALIRRDESVDIINDHMLYSVSIPAPVEVLRLRKRSGVDYRYSGFLAGIRKREDGAAGNSRAGYDMLLSVDSEKFLVPIKDLPRAVAIWGNNLGYEGLRREVLSESERSIVYQFTNSGPPRYMGLEGIFINGPFTHCVRLVTSDVKYYDGSGIIKNIIASFKTVSKTD